MNTDYAFTDCVSTPYVERIYYTHSIYIIGISYLIYIVVR